MLRSGEEIALAVNHESKKAVVIKPAENAQNIPFLDQKNLFTSLARHASLIDMGRLRRTCRTAYHRFNDQAIAEPMKMLELVTKLDVHALEKFTQSNAALIESWRVGASHYYAAYAAYALLGDVRNLDIHDYPVTIDWLEEQKVSIVILDCMRLMRNHKLGISLFFSQTLDDIASHHMADPRLGEIRPILLYFLFHASRLMEERGARNLDERYAKVKEFLQLAKDHTLFARHRNQNVFSMFGIFARGNDLTTSQHSIQHEIEMVEKRYAATQEGNKLNYVN